MITNRLISSIGCIHIVVHLESGSFLTLESSAIRYWCNIAHTRSPLFRGRCDVSVHLNSYLYTCRNNRHCCTFSYIHVHCTHYITISSTFLINNNPMNGELRRDARTKARVNRLCTPTPGPFCKTFSFHVNTPKTIFWIIANGGFTAILVYQMS